MQALKQPSEQLAQLKDIHLPEQVHNYPIALGWWILLACLLLTIIIMLVRWQKRRKLCQAKKLALSKLKSTTNNDDIVILLKWAAFQYFPRNELAALHGEQLKDFFKQKLTSKHQEKFLVLCQQHFSHKYQSEPSTSSDSLQQAAHLWLSQALPPKALKVVKEKSSFTSQGVSS